MTLRGQFFTATYRDIEKQEEELWWHNISAVEEDTLKVMHYNILVCGVLIRKACIIGSVILVSWIKYKLSLYSHDIKTSQILSLNTVTSRKFVVGVRAKSSFWIGEWAATRFGRNSQPVLGIEFVRMGYRIQRFQWQGICIIVFILMPPTNPTPCLYLRVMWICTLDHVGGGNVWRGYPVEGYFYTHWLTGLWSTQAKVEGIVLKAAWHWGSDSRVVNNPFGEPGQTPLYVGLLSVWASVDSDRMFSPISLGELLNWGL
jgi:hypothetical protein